MPLLTKSRFCGNISSYKYFVKGVKKGISGRVLWLFGGGSGMPPPHSNDPYQTTIALALPRYGGWASWKYGSCSLFSAQGRSLQQAAI